MAGNYFVLGFVYMCPFCTLPCHIFCEMLRFYPMLMKFYMLKLDILLDILVLIWYFYHLWLLFYDHVKAGETICVTPLLVHLDWYIFHAKWIPNVLIFCMMLDMNVVNAHDFWWNFWIDFWFNWDFSFWMVTCELLNCLDFHLIMKCLFFIQWMWNFAH